MLSTILGATALAISAIAVYFAAVARNYAHECYEYVEQNNKRSIALKRLVGIETELTEQHDSITALSASLKKLRGRAHARSVNEKKAGDHSESDEDWKRRTNASLINQ